MTKFSKLIIIGSSSLLLGILTPVIYADKGGMGKGGGGWHDGKSMGHQFQNQGSMMQNQARMARGIQFSPQDRDAITNYFSTRPYSGTGLPPGIAMNLARGKPLPPGISAQNLPSDLSNSLPYYPGYDYRMVGNNVVLMNSNTGIIADILSNAVLRH